MISANDVAAYILQKQERMTTMKLQKLVYYSQAWALVWDEAYLFEEKIEAWANGPVVRALYNKHKGQFEVSTWSSGDALKLSRTQKATINAVIKFYGNKSSQWLSDLTHEEDPWKNARKGLQPGQFGHTEITPASMAEYYGSL